MPAFETPSTIAPRTARAIGTTDVVQLLTRLLREESALYAISREWRHDSAEHKLSRLRLLLDDHFPGTGRRLVRLATRLRALSGTPFSGHRKHAPRSPLPATNGTRETHMILALLEWHDALLSQLREGLALTAGHIQDRATTELLTELTGDHEKDAFQLRALQWEVQNHPA